MLSLTGKSPKNSSIKSKKNNRQISNRCPPFPPPFNAAIQFKHRFRFTATEFVTTTITSANLMSLLYYAPSATPGTTFYSLITAFRLRKVYVWSVGGLVSVEFQTTNNANVGARPAVQSDTSFGGTYYSKVCAVPPRGSAAAQWQNVTTASNNTDGTQFILTIPQGGVIDVVMDVVLQNGDPVYQFSSSLAVSAVVGNIYMNYLDGLSSLQLTPVSYFSAN